MAPVKTGVDSKSGLAYNYGYSINGITCWFCDASMVTGVLRDQLCFSRSLI